MIIEHRPYLEFRLTELDLEIERLRHEINVALAVLPMDRQNALAKIIQLDTAICPTDEAELAVLTSWHRLITGRK